MNIRDFQYLIAVAETEHFGEAARRCFVSQPTLSTQLKKLEDELGAVLIERSTKRVRLSPLGERVLAEARHILQSVKKIKHMAALEKDPFSGPFHLGIIPTLGPYLLPRILPAIQKTLPHLEIILYETKTIDVLQALRAGQLDAAIIALPVKLDGLAEQDLFNEPFYVLLPKSHPLSAKKMLTTKELERESLLLLEEGHCLRDQALEACQIQHVNQTYRATSLETLQQMVSLGAGITLVPALASDRLNNQSELMIKSLSGDVPCRQIGMIWRKTAVNSVCIEKMAACIREAAKHWPILTSASPQKILKKRLDH